MKTLIKILALVLLTVGSFIAGFILLVLVLGALNSLGIMQGQANQNFYSAVTVFILLVYPAIWIIRTGRALLSFRRSGRWPGIAITSGLFVALNAALLLTKDQPGKVGNGFVIFHLLMILIGVYGVLVLAVASRNDFVE